jgi:hypothetical protein
MMMITVFNPDGSVLATEAIRCEVCDANDQPTESFEQREQRRLGCLYCRRRLLASFHRASHARPTDGL